ncbi:putative bacteriocin precursor [Clostridium estertheticum]|uniref:putative bacteriocin precursor n=1 Tax=Clostridium estertheticum TaxID=238834 RepID=UPI001C0D89EA|nr:putative bacteriocin precursor [Clostridium estertheticum]MBU3178950.1 putative bacteriocin precursor [Clostridium estertheticum]
MKVLGKKRDNDIQTIEAYDFWACAGLGVCHCTTSRPFQSLNNNVYKENKYDLHP